MLSILIPIYNYPIKPLIDGLERGLKHIDFDVEILCIEDGSTKYKLENKAACSKIQEATLLVSKENKGRIFSRKKLSQNAKYDWLLFLDADLELNDDNFLNNYAVFFTLDYDAIFGGCSYDIIRPNDNEILRWKYGNTYEDVDATIRNKAAYKHIVSANFIIKKDIITELYSNIEHEGYGYDILLGALMESYGIKVFHINNPAIHKGLDKSDEFLKKVQRAVETSFNLQQDDSIQFPSSSLIKTYKKLKRLKLIALVSKIFELYKNSLKRNLLGSNPNIKLLQFYKLGYLCSLSSKT